nr:hypothetical protein [Tanacetum cinerariifolium]
MILESVEHGLLIWPTIEENEVTMTKKYAELSATEKLQADCDMKAINIIFQGLPTEIYSLVNHHRVAKELWEKVQLLIQGTSLTKPKRAGRQNSYAAGTSGTRANPSGTRGNYSCQQRIMKCLNCQGEGYMERQYPKPKRKMDATWSREKILLVEAQGNGKVLTKEELEFLADPGIAEAKAFLMANLSSYGSDVLSEVPKSDNTHNDMLNQSRINLRRTSITGFQAQSIRSSNAIAIDSLYLLVLNTGASQSRQHGFPFITVYTKEYHSECSGNYHRDNA